jgi:hypothetical protein
MSLLRLLTAGKCLVGLKDYRSRYVTRGGLPKFGSKKNPFRATVRPEPSVEQAQSLPANGELCAVNDQREPGGDQTPSFNERGTVPRSEPGVMPGAEKPVVAERLAASSKPRRVKSEKGWDWGKVAFWNRPKPARQAGPTLIKPMLQGELSLDGVKVVRNDLSDTDFEVVSCRPPTGATAGPAQASAKAPAPAAPVASEAKWARVTGRLFGAGKL